MVIEKANASHIPGLIALLDQVGRVHHNIRPDIFPAGTRKYEKADLEILLTDEKRPVFVAEEDGRVLGYCFCVVKSHAAGTCSMPRQELYIDDLCVDENHHRRGIARALYLHGESYARSLGCHSLTLNVWCGNDDAMAFYEAMGLHPRNIMMETRLEEKEC